MNAPSSTLVSTDAEFARIVDELTRRGFLAGGLGTAALAALTACGGSDTGNASSSAAGSPIAVQDRFGTVHIPRPPSTVAAVGRTDADALLALGVVPAAVYQFVPSMTHGVGPWALDKLGSARPAILTNPVDYETVAALHPDLILDVQSFGEEKQYRTLSGIAPTVGLPAGATPNAVSWQQSTELIAAAVGRPADGQRLVTQTENYLSGRAAARPEFAGRSVTVLLTYGRDVGVYTAGDTRMQLLTALGFAPSSFVAGLGTGKFFVQLSTERLGDIDSDVVVVLSQTGQSRADQVKAFPTLADIPGYQDGRVVFVEDLNVSLALSAASVLSIPYAVAALEPLLAGAVGR